MNSAPIFIKKIIKTLKINPLFENIELVAAYENEIKPYPVTHPILAFAVQSETVSDRLIDIATDGSQTQSNRRKVETVFKVSVFVPYESGTVEAYRMADYLYSTLLFQTTLPIVGCKYADCNYVRDCGALVLDTTFTMCTEVSE